MKRKIFVFMILGVCATMSAWADYPIGTFVAPKGADGINGTNGTNGTAGCSPRIYQTNKTGGCYQIKSQAQKRVSGVCTDDTSINAVTLDNICDGCTPTYSKKYIHGSVSSPTYNDTSANAIGTRVTISGCGEDSVNIDTYDGDDGTSFNYLGTVANCNALPTSPTPSANDAYLVKGTGLGRVCIYTGNGWPTCPDDCAEFTGPAGDNNCTGLETSDTAVKNTTLTYSGPTKSDSGLSYYTTKGKMTTSHTPCNPNATIDDSVQDDSCTLIAAPSGSTCTGSKKTYYECKTQAADGSLAKGATYNLCVSTAGDSISNALDGKEDTACVGDNSNSASVERKKTVSYTAPTKTNSGDSYYTTSGKVVNKSVKCNNSETTISSTPDKCDEEIAKPSGVCTDTNKVYYKCTRQDNGSEYNLCAVGNSVLGAAQSAAETAVAAVDPCAGNTYSSTIIKTTSTTAYSRGTKTGNLYSNIGSKTVTKTACDGITTYTTTEQDSCVEIAKPENVCTAATSAYLRCYNAHASSDKTYYVCQDLGANNNSLANKIATAENNISTLQTTVSNKADASEVTQSALADTLGNTYLKPSDTISTSQLPSNVVTTTDGKINAGVLPSTVVTVGNDATHGFNTLLGNSVSTAVTDAIYTEIGNGSEGVFKDFVTNGTLASAVSTEVESAISEKSVTFGNLQITLDEALELLGAAAGTCTRSSGGLGSSDGTVSCSGGGLGSVSTTGKD